MDSLGAKAAVQYCHNGSTSLGRCVGQPVYVNLARRANGAHLSLVLQFQGMDYVIASVENMKEAVKV